ncbi:DedA family protein [Thorsellia anophelis]|uniref:Membrane protein DedA, SNARE-associated domain n=1 Tax=Thorsellia anophelis DSM 18579 TaxID=1123402 RepID=A0A1I0CP81_9GAMM|nr:DedA family protein [Thorsellia anophelis]SET20835.1 membrane protein DedA, SNARE-associated domain [Thorsellia anophelis DSM 18579]
MMQTLAQFLTESIFIAALILFVITFVESIAIVGLLVPSAIIMTAVGALIAQSYFNFYLAWAIAFLGCFLGDGCSFLLGKYFKTPIMKNSWIIKQKKIIDKAESSLINNRFMAIVLGRYIGVFRPIIPLFAGILNLNWKAYIVPSFVACLTWPVLYLLPGIIAGAAAKFPEGVSPTGFQLLLALVIIMSWLLLWFIPKFKKIRKLQSNRCDDNPNDAEIPRWLIQLCHKKTALILIGLSCFVLVCATYLLVTHPLFSVYSSILKHVFSL